MGLFMGGGKEEVLLGKLPLRSRVNLLRESGIGLIYLRESGGPLSGAARYLWSVEGGGCFSAF